ncbi:MAG: undecaprenyl-diphosphate phosphatase [Planctomycetes bacterium]|nr:undecaprenyl-diphosphate phosphatase [Planctomycetota bacterium]
MSLQQAAVLGVVEGLTEYLPVSSTGHLIIAGHLMGHSKFSDQPGPLGKKIISSDAIGAFDIVIQLGAILAVLGLYRGRVGQMCLGIAGRDPWGLRLLGLLMLAFLPSAAAGLLLHRPIEENLFSPMTVCWALFAGGLLMIAVEWFYRARRAKTRRLNLNQMTAWRALFIGLAQCLALWPGTSRSMITIVAAMLVGMEILAAAEFSFLLALPTLGAATVYSGIKDWDGLMNSAGPDGLAVGLIVSAVVAAISVKLMIRWLTRHGLTPFGVYRIAIAGVIWWLLIA